MKSDFYETHFPTNTTLSHGENVVGDNDQSRLTTAYSQDEVNYYMAAAIFASVATVSKQDYTLDIMLLFGIYSIIQVDNFHRIYYRVSHWSETWVWLTLILGFYCLLNSGWVDGKLAEMAWQ